MCPGFGTKMGWGSPVTLGLLALGVAALVATIAIERRSDHPFLDLRLFGNRMFSGAALANTAIGMLIVTQQLLQLAGRMKPVDAALLTLGYAAAVTFCMRAGEVLLRRYGDGRGAVPARQHRPAGGVRGHHRGLRAPGRPGVHVGVT